MNQPKDIDSGLPSDTQHPKLYENTAFILGVVIVLGIIAVTVLAVLGKASDAAITGIVGIAMVCATALARMFELRKAQ